MVLRITFNPGVSSRAILRLEGSVSREWAALLETECSALLGRRVLVSLDLTSVWFIDRGGLEVLARLEQAGVELRGPIGAVAAVLEGEGIRFTRDTDAASSAGH